jgi:hypothetical protein
MFPSPSYEDGTLSGLSNVHVLQLAGNRISSFRDITRLSTQLPSLRHLFLNDPHWGSNPVCSLANYNTFALCSLPPHVQSLDSTNITREARAVALAKFTRKSMHYSMRLRKVKRSLIAVQETARIVAEVTVSMLSASLPSLHFAIRTLEAHIVAAEDEINAVYSLAIPVTSSALPLVSVPSSSLSTTPSLVGEIQTINNNRDTASNIQSLPSLLLPPSIPLPKSPLLAHCAWPPLRPLAGLASTPPPLLFAAKSKRSMLIALVSKREADICALNEALAALNISVRTCAAVFSERIDVELNTGRNTSFEEVLPSSSTTHPHHPPFSSNKQLSNNESSIFPQQVTMNMHQMMMMTSPVKMISSSSSSSSFSSQERESSSIFTACSRFVKSRFLKESFSCLHVADVKVSRVVKVSNNQLRSRFEKRVAALVETVPFLKQAIDEFFIPHCDSSLATFGGEEKEEEQGGSSNSGGGGGGVSEQSMSLRSAMSLLLGESGMRTGVDFVMFSPRWSADGIAAAASVSTPTALQQPLQKNSLQHQQHQQQIFKSAKAGTIIGGQSSLSMSLQDAVGVGIGPSSIWKNGSSLRDAHHRSGSTTNKDLHRHTNSTSSFSSSSLHISAEAESESVRRSISRIAESGFSAVDATVATPTQPLFPDYCTPPSPSFASPTLNMKPARTNRLDVAAQSSVLNHHQHIRKGRRGGGGGGASSGSSPLDFDNIPLHPPLGATLLPCLSASTALGIPVTNSLACADLPRLAEAVAARLELKKELHWRRARFPEYSAEMATATSTDNNNNNNSYSGNSYSTDESRRLLSSSSSSRVKNTQENSFAFYTPTRAEREILLSRMSLNGGNTTQKGDNSVNIVNKISSSSSLNGSKKDSTTRTSSSSSSSSINATRSNKVALSQPSVQSAVQSAALTVAASQAQMLDWLRPRVNIPLFAALDLGPAHWLACAGIDIHSLIHKSILRKALRAATLTNSNGYGGGEDEDEEGEGSATIGSRQLLSSQQIAAAAASASILSPAPFSGPIRQSFTGRMNTPGGGGGGGGDSSNNGGRGGSGISRIFSPLSTSSASLSPLASSSSMIRSGRVILCRSFLGNVLDLCSGTNLLEASQGARHLPTSFYGDPLLTPAGQAAAALAHSTSQRLLSRHTTDNKGEGGTVKKTATPSVTTSATSFDSQQPGSSKGGGSGGQLNGAQIFGAEGGERLWAVLDPHLLVPEYIVDFSYVFEGEDDAEKEAAAAVTAIMLDSSSSLSSSTTTTTTISEEKNRIERQKQKKMKKNPVPSSSEVPISTSPSSCAIPTPSSSVQSASISSVSSTSSPPPSSPSSKNKETTKNRRQAGDMENTSPPLAPSSRSDLANALLRLHSICCSPTSLSKSSSSNFATLSSSERSQLSSSNLGQTFQAAAAMLRKARSMRSGGGVGGGGGGAITEASVSSLTLALQSIANLISFDRSSSEQQQQQQQQRSSLLSLLLPSAEDVELRALLPSLLSFSRLIVDVASLYLGGGPSRVVTDGSEYMNDPQVNTSKSGGMGEIRYPLNSTLIDSVALDALSMLPRTSPFESRIGKDNNEGDYNNRRRSLLSTPPWLTAITSSSLLSSSHWLPQELSIVTVNSTGDTIDHIESISKKMDPLEMFIQSNPSLMLASSSSSSSSSTSLTTKVPSLPLSQPLTLCLSASALANLTSLCLDGCGLSGRLSLYGIASCSGLRRISLAFNRLTHLDGLSSCAALHEVDASYNLVKSLLIDEGATTIKKEKKVMNGTTGGATDRTRRGKKNAWGRVNNKIENEDEEEEENDIGGEIGGDSGRKNRVYSDTDALERSNSTAYESVLGACHFLHDLRLSHNLFSNISDVLLGIMRRPMLRVLDLRGNPFLLPSSERSKSSYLPRVLSSLPGLGVLDECSITEADWRLVEANRCKFKRRSVLQQPELIARIAVGGEKASRDAFLFQPIARADEEEEEDDDDDGWKVRSHITHNDDVDNDDIYWQSLRECGKDYDEALAVSSVVFDSIAAEAMRLLDRHPPLRLPHSLDLSGMYISGSALRTKQAAYTLAAMPSLKKLSLSNNAIKSLVEENDVASHHHHHHQRDHHFTLSALSMATNLTELDLHNCNLRVLAHSHSAMVHATHVKMSNENNSIPAAASVGAAEASAVVTSSSSSMMTSGMFDLLTDLSSLVSNIVRVHREVDASSSTPSAHHDHHHSFDDENIIVSDLTAERIKRFPLWGFAMTKRATGICALISSEEQQNGGRDTSDRRQSALDVYPSSSSSSSVSLTIDLDRDDHSRFTESDSPSPFLTPIVVASTVDAEDDDENNENNINLIISGKSRDAFDEAATVVTSSREFAVASHQKQQLQQQQLQQQRLSSRQGSSGTSRKSSSTTTPQPIEASSSSSSPINSPFIVAGLPGLPHTSFSPVDLSTPPSLLLPNPPSSSSSIRFVKFLPLIPLVSPLLASGSNLRRLDLSYNELCDKAVIDARLDLLPNLITLSLERNKLRTFDGVKGCSGLLELYLGLNEIGGGGGGGGEEGSERRRTRGLGLKNNDDDDGGGGGGGDDDSDGDDEEGRQSDATTSSPFSNSEESLRHSSSMFAIPLGSSSSSSSTLLSSTASPLLRMLRAVASEPVSIISEGGTVSPRNVMNANAGGSGSGVISTAPLPLLSILDLTGNPIASVKGYREATLRRARKLRVLDGVSVSAADLAAAGSDRINGKLTVEWLEDRAAALAEEEGGGIQWADVPLNDGDEDLLDASLLPRHPLSLTLDLDYASAHIRDVELLSPLSLPHVRSISLDHNQLSDEGIGGLKLLLYSPTLKSLSLNHNKVVSLLPALGREKGAAAVVGGVGGGASEEIASTIISLLPQLSRESKIWGSVCGKNKSVASTNHETRDEEMVSLQRGDEGSGNGREGVGEGDGRGRGGVDEVLSREINKSGANSNSFLRAGSGGAAAAASILAAMEKDYEGGGGGGGIMNEDVRRNHQYQIESSTSMNEEERRTSSSFFLHQSHSKGAPHPPPNHHHHHHHLSPNYNHNITLINSRDIYCRLERLHLVHNGIVSMEGLGLLHLPKLREIDLSHNEIAKVGGLAGCKSLSSITLNGNVIRALDLVYLSRSCPLLTHLSVMDNGLRSLTGNAAVSSANSISSFGHLRHLLSVNLSSNRISDVNELEPLLLFAASSLITSVSFALNPVSRRPNYRSALLARLPELLSIDGREVLMEERGGGGGQGGGVGQGGGLVATHFLHQQGHGGAQQHQNQQQQTNSQLFKLFGQVGQTSGQLLGQQQQQQQHQRIIQSSQPLYQQASIHMGPLALSMVAALNNVKGGEVTGGNGNGGVNENIVKESSSVTYSGGAMTFSTANGGQTPSTNGGQMLSSTSVATERLPKELTLSSKLLTKDHSSSSSSSSGLPAAASAAQTQSSSSLSSSSSSLLLSSSSSSLFGLPSSSDRLMKDSPSPYGVIPHGNTAGAAQSAPSTTAGAQSTPILTRGGGESSSVNVGHDALFGAVVNHYKERGNGGVGGGGGGGGGSGGGTSSYYVMHRGYGVGKGSLLDKEKSSSGLSSSRSEGGGLSLTTISLSLPKTGKKNGKGGGNNGKKVDR